MKKLLIGLWLITTTVLAQTTPKAAQTSSTKSTSSSAARSTRPLPQPSLAEKLDSRDNALPGYRKAKANGEHKVKNRFSPRRTASGARKDTLEKHQ